MGEKTGFSKVKNKKKLEHCLNLKSSRNTHFFLIPYCPVLNNSSTYVLPLGQRNRTSYRQRQRLKWRPVSIPVLVNSGPDNFYVFRFRSFLGLNIGSGPVFMVFSSNYKSLSCSWTWSQSRSQSKTRSQSRSWSWTLTKSSR